MAGASICRPRARPPVALILAGIMSLFGSASVALAQVGSCEHSVGEAFLDVGNVRARIFNNGGLFWRGWPPVYEVPKGSGRFALFDGNLWIGGLVDGQLRTSAGSYGRYEFWAGPLEDNGNPLADCSLFDKIWKVSVFDVSNLDAGGVPTVDLATWPTGLGAPTLAPAADDGEDNDGDGIVDESGEMKEIHEEILQLPLANRVYRVIDLGVGERPAIVGDQMLWWIMNDRGNTHEHTESPPIGLEVHATAFAFDRPGYLGNATFYKADLYYKGGESLEHAYVSLWSSPALGNIFDNYVGSDTTLGLGFVYNGDNDDGNCDQCYGEAPPALGYTLLQGPIVPSAGDTALVSGTVVPNNRDVGMTSFMHFPGSGIGGDPSYAPEIYNVMQGRWRGGSAIQAYGRGYAEEGDHPESTIMFPGDPVTGQFWSEVNDDGQGGSVSPGERRFVLSSGPFTIASGGHQEIVYAIVWARGADNLDSIAELRNATRLAHALADVNFDQTALDEGLQVENASPDRDGTAAPVATAYPNPVADVLTIQSSGLPGWVDVSVHDLLGRLVAKSRHLGGEDIRIDMSSFKSGRYLLRLETERGADTRLVVKR